MDPILFIRKEVADLARREYGPTIVYKYGNTVISSIHLPNKLRFLCRQ